MADRPAGPDAHSDAALAALAAAAAGEMLLTLRRAGLAGGGALGAIGDAVADTLLTRLLRAHRPADGLLCEEGACDGSRFRAARVWMVDPLDGTREYGEGRDDWAVHVALVSAGVAVLGVVAVPANGDLHRSDAPRPLAPPSPVPRMLVSRTRPAPEAAALARRIGATLVPMGSAGAKVAALIDGRAEAYVHSGDLNDWDAAAPVAVALAHGLHVSHLDGTPVRFNARVPRIADLLVCRAELAGALLSRA